MKIHCAYIIIFSPLLYFHIIRVSKTNLCCWWLVFQTGFFGFCIFKRSSFVFFIYFFILLFFLQLKCSSTKKELRANTPATTKRQNRNHHHFQKKIKIESLLLWFTLFITPLYGSFAVTVAAVVVDGVFSSMILLDFGF